MDWYVKAFIRASLLWFTGGIALGLAMAVHPAWVVYRPAHAHMNVVGFLTMMVYGGEAALLMAAVDGLSSSLYVSKKLRVCLFNSAQMILSTFVTMWTLRLFFGPLGELGRGDSPLIFIGGICVMPLVQYACNSGIVAIYTALKTDQPIFATWRSSYLWTSITYFAGASVAAIAVHVAKGLSVYAVFMITPIVAIIYFTYKTYLKTIQVSAQKAEEAKPRRIEVT